MENKLTEQQVREIASIAWKGAANAFRLYPDNKHTFIEYWNAAKNEFKEFIHSEKICPTCGSNKIILFDADNDYCEECKTTFIALSTL